MQKVYRALGITFLFLLAVCGTALAQGTQVSGTVTSATTGEKLWGVTVRVKGTQTQTVTDQQGRYSLVAPADAVLTFAQIGFRGKEQAIGGQSTLDVSLEQAHSIGDLVESEGLGCGVDYRDEDGLVAALVSILDQPGGRAVFAERFKSVADRLGWGSALESRRLD